MDLPVTRYDMCNNRLTFNCLAKDSSWNGKVKLDQVIKVNPSAILHRALVMYHHCRRLLLLHHPTLQQLTVADSVTGRALIDRGSVGPMQYAVHELRLFG